MAEQTNKQNIEDVLSSIRRLVSDEGTHAPRAPTPGLRPEKLVLTPQLRVTEPEDPYQTIRVLGQSEQPLDEMDEAFLEDAPDADVLMAPMAGDGRADAMPVLDPALERAFAAPADESTAEPEAVETSQDNGEANRGSASIEADETAASEAPMVEVATLEASDDSIPQDPPPAAAEAPQNPPPAIPFPQKKVLRTADSKPQDGDEVLDEETLREIIAEVVREEFTGQLGERITRNVRKLVRREIRQILSSEDLD